MNKTRNNTKSLRLTKSELVKKPQIGEKAVSHEIDNSFEAAYFEEGHLVMKLFLL